MTSPIPIPKKEWPKHPRVSIAVLVPVLGRPERVKPMIDSLRQSTDEATIYFIANESDREEVLAIRKEGANLLLCEGVSWAKKINFGFFNTREPWMLLGADDLKFHPGWIDKVRTMLASKKVGVVGTNDGGNSTTFHGAHSTHPLVSREYAIRFGTMDHCGICCEQYHHNYVDNEIVATAKLRGQWAHEPECLIEHLHPLWGKAPSDPTYLKGQERIHEDCALFTKRSSQFWISISSPKKPSILFHGNPMKSKPIVLNITNVNFSNRKQPSIISSSSHPGKQPSIISSSNQSIPPSVPQSVPQSVPRLDLSKTTLSLVVTGKSEQEIASLQNKSWLKVPNELFLIANSDYKFGGQASIGNRYLRSSKSEIFGLVHADVDFGSGQLEIFMDAAFKENVVGIVGRSSDGRYRWSNDGEASVDTLDGCSIFFRRDSGLFFDENTFDHFHSVVEDICIQAAIRGIRVMVPKAKATHVGETTSNKNWTDMASVYRSKLYAKYPDRKIWTT